MFKTIFFLLGIYILYKLVFDFIIPVYKATNNMQRQFKDARQKMQEQANAQQKAQQQYQQQQEQAQRQSSAAKAGDYIDFEEVK